MPKRSIKLSAAESSVEFPAAHAITSHQKYPVMLPLLRFWMRACAVLTAAVAGLSSFVLSLFAPQRAVQGAAHTSNPDAPGAQSPAAAAIYPIVHFNNFFMKISLRRSRLIAFALLIVFVILSSSIYAQVNVTAATGGTNISADKAKDASSPLPTTLGDIIIAETANGKGDIALSSSGTATIILTAPSAWEFVPNSGSVTFNSGQDIASTSIVVTASTITLTVTANSGNVTNKQDQITISNLQVIAKNGSVLPSVGDILRTSASPGTLSINGITNDVTSFGALSQKAGTVKKLSFTTQPGGATIYGSNLTQQPIVKTQDQFGNLTTSGLSTTLNVTLSLTSGTGTLSGTSTINIGTGGGNGTATFTDIKINAVGSNKQLTASALGLTSAVSSSFTITAKALTVSSAAAQNKVYDKTNAAVITGTLSGVETGDAVNLSGTGTFASVNVGTGITVTSTSTLTGAQAGNYSLTQPTGLSADITAKSLIGSFTVSNKVYDGTTTATITNRLLSGIVGSDIVSLTGGSASFIDANVGIAKTVTQIGMSLIGTASGNYSLTSVGNTSADITVRPVTITADAKTKIYGTLDPDLTYQVTSGSVVSSDAFAGNLSRDAGEDLGTYVIRQGTVALSSNYNLSYVGANLTILPQDGLPVGASYYTGSSFYWTNGATNSTATVTLAATVKNKFIGWGNITTAKVSFYIRNADKSLTPITGAQNLPVGLVTPGEFNVGVASAIVQFNIGSNTYQDYDIAVKITGNYKNDFNNPCFDGHIAIAKPAASGELTGSSNLDNIGAAGQIVLNSADKSYYRFDIVYNKSLKNPMGKVEIITSPTVYNGSEPIERYHIVSNAISVLAVNGCTAQFSAKSNVYRQYKDALGNWVDEQIEGGSIVQIDAEDKTTNTSNSLDLVGITVFRKAGGIWYSSKWDGTRTVVKPIDHGHLSVGCTLNNNAAARMAEPVTIAKPAGFSLKAYPNPSSAAFNLQVATDNSKDAIQLRVVDMFGRVMEVKNNVAPNSTLQLGWNYKAGIYMVELIQGDNRKQVKLVKQ